MPAPMTAAEWKWPWDALGEYVVRSLGACVDLKLRVTFTGTPPLHLHPDQPAEPEGHDIGPIGQFGFQGVARTR